jgi:DNA-binding transcriptional LysR family regulator
MAINLRHMEVFRAVYSSRSVSLGAEILGISQPSVSRMIRHIEDRLGYQLFRLHRGRIVPTPEADRLFDAVDQIFERVEHAVATARAIGEGQSERLSVVAIQSFAGLVPQPLRQLKREYPRIDLSLNVLAYRAQLQAITQGMATIGIAANVPGDPGLEHRVIGKGSFVAVIPAGHALAARERVSLEELATHPSILPPRNSPWGQQIYRAFDAYGLEPVVELLMHAPLLCEDLVSSFECPSILDTFAASRIRNPSSVVTRPINVDLAYEITAFWSPLSPLSAAATRLLDLLASAFVVD